MNLSTLRKPLKRYKGQKAWSESETDFLSKYWGHLSPRMIGRATGRTRNSVIGKAHRLGLCKSKPTPQDELNRHKRLSQSDTRRPVDFTNAGRAGRRVQEMKERNDH